MKTLIRFPFLWAIAALLFSSAALPAQDADEAAISNRMRERVEQVDALKVAGKVGENNAGLLEQRAQLSQDETRLLQAENADRRALYTLIGKRLGLTQTVVGQGRAEDLRKRSAAGVWLQDPNGRWYRKE